MIKMKSLRSGNFGQNATKVRRGREFSVSTDLRAQELEREGYAYRIDVKAERAPLNKMAPAPSNKAAEAGPLDSHGGTTGADAPVSSSPPERQPRRRRSTPSQEQPEPPAGDKDLLSSQ